MSGLAWFGGFFAGVLFGIWAATFVVLYRPTASVNQKRRELLKQARELTETAAKLRGIQLREVDVAPPYTCTRAQFEDLIRRADAYIKALRQVIYSGRPEVRRSAGNQLNELGSCWQAARQSLASDIEEL